MHNKKYFIEKVQIITLCLFFFSVNFEVWDPFYTNGFFSISKFTGLIYLFSLIPHMKYYLRLSNLKSLLIPIFIFFGLLTLTNLFYLISAGSRISNFFNISIFLNILLFIILVNHERKDQLVLEKAMLSFAVGSVALSLLYIFGIGIDYISGRVRIFGDNPNIIGIKLCIAILVLVLNVIQNRLNFNRLRYFFLLPCPLILHLMAQTGSRVAIISFSFSLIIGVLLFKSKNFLQKFIAIVFGALFSIYDWMIIINSRTLSDRLIDSWVDGKLSGRERIWPELIQLIISNPFFGVGETGYENFSNKIFGKLISPHNVIMELLCYTGLVGLILYFIFLYQLFKETYHNYKIFGFLQPLLLLIPISGILLSGQILNIKIGWCIFSYIAGFSVTRSKRKQSSKY